MSGTTVALTGDYGLTYIGFIRMRLPEIISRIKAQLETNTGLTFETSPDTITGQTIGAFAEQIAIAWEQLEQLFFAMYPESAVGVALDNAVAYAGVFRLLDRATSSIATLITNVPGTIVPGNTQVGMSSNLLHKLFLQSDVTIEAPNANYLQYKVPIGTTAASLRLNGTLYNGVGANASATAVNLAAAIDANPFIYAEVQSFLGDFFVQMWSVNNSIIAPTDIANLTLDRIGSPGVFESDDFSTFVIAARDIDTILTPQAGLIAVTNVQDGTPGREEETDEQLRERYRTGVYRLGAGTTASVEALLRQLPGVTLARVFENEEDTTDAEGRPPHSIEAVVIGGDNVAISELIQRYKGGGVNTFGNNTFTILDRNGIEKDVMWSRPVDKYIWLDVAVAEAAEEGLPIDYVARVKAAIMTLNSKFRPGGNVYLDRIKGTYASVTGIASSVMTATTGTLTVPGTYSGADIAISNREIARFADDRIDVA